MPGGVWAERAARQSGGYGSGAGTHIAPAGTYDMPSVRSRGGGNPAYFGVSDGNTQKRQFASVGKMNVNLLDPLAAERAMGDYVPVDAPPEGPFGGIQRYYSPSTPGGIFAGVLGAVGQTVGGFFGKDIAKGGAELGATVGKTLEIPMTVVGGLGVESVPFVAPAIDQANSVIEENSPYILRDTLKIPKNIGGAFQSMLNVLGLAGRAVERTYAGLSGQRGALPADIEARVTSGELTHDQALDELVMSGRGFTNEPIHNMAFSILTDPANWLSLGVGAVAGAAKGTAGIARVFSSAALREGGVVARMANEAGEVGDLARAAIAGESILDRNISRGALSQMRSAVNRDMVERVANGEDIPNHLKLGLAERMGMSALGPVRDSATENAVFSIAQKIARATDPINFFSGSKAGQRSMEQLHIASSTGVMAALKPGVVRGLTKLADGIVSDGGERILDSIGTWGANALQEVVAHEGASDAMRVGAIPKVGSLTPTEATRQTLAGGGFDTNIGKYVENHVERTKDIRVASLSGDTKAADGSVVRGQRYNETVAKLAAILGVEPTAVAAKVGSVDADMAMAVHGLYYYRKGKALHTDVVNELGEMSSKGTLPKDIDPNDMTMVTPRTMTNKRVVDLDAAIKAGNPEAVRAITENYDDFNWMNRQTVPDGEVIATVRAWLDTNRAMLPKEIDLIDPVTGKLRTDLGAALEEWAQDSGTFGYGLANGMPADAPLEAQFRVTRNANGKMLNANPWLNFWADGTPMPKQLSRWDSMRMSMFRGIRGERILWNQRRRFITDMASDRAGNIAFPPAMADRIFKALMYEAQGGHLLPRGMSPDQMMDAAGRVLIDARNHSGTWGNLGGQMTERQIVAAFLRAMEGDVSLVGATQKATGRIKSAAPGAGANYWGQLSERLYPLMRFTLNPVFMAMEATEPYILGYMRGVPLPLRRNQPNFEQGLATHNAVRQLIFASTEPHGLMAESAEMNALRLYGAAEARSKFGPRTLWGRIRQTRPAIAERKQAAAGLQARQLIGDNLYRAFKEIKGDDFDRFWGDLEYEYGTVSRAEVAERWISQNLSLMDKDGRKVSLVMDLMNPKNLGQRLRFSTDGSRSGDYTYGDVEELLDGVRIENGLPTRISGGKAAGDQLLEDLKTMDRADWLDEVKRANGGRARRISDSQAEDIWYMARGPKPEPFWKGYRGTYLRGITGTTAVETRRLRDAQLRSARSFVRAAATGKGISEEEFIATHFRDIPTWAVDAGVLPPQALTDIREHFVDVLFKRANAESNPYSTRNMRWAMDAKQEIDETNPNVMKLREGTANRDYVFIPIEDYKLSQVTDAYRRGGENVLAPAYAEVGTDPIRLIGRSRGSNILRVKRSTTSVTREHPQTNLKRLKSHDHTLDYDLYPGKDIEVFTETGWKPWDEYAAPTGGVAAPKLRQVPQQPWWSKLLGAADDTEGQTFPWGVDLREALTPQQKATTANYTGIGYVPINSWLRGLPISDAYEHMTDERIEQAIEYLDAAVQRGSFRDRKPLYRGIDITEAADEGIDLMPFYDKQVGETLMDPAYLSTSDDIDTAIGFAGYRRTTDHRSVLVHYDMPPGWPMNLVEGGEGEFMLGRGISFRVVERRDVGGRIELHVVPESPPQLRGVNRDMLGQPPVGRQNEEVVRQLAHSDPDQLRALAAKAPDDTREGYTELVEEAIARAEAVKPAVREAVGGRKFGPLTPQQTLDDIIEQVDENDIPAYRTAWSDLRERVSGLFSTEPKVDEFGEIDAGDEAIIASGMDTRVLAALGTAAPTLGRRSLTQFLGVMEALWHGRPAALKAVEGNEQQTLAMAQDLLRGVKTPMAVPDMPVGLDDSMDVLLGNTSRRATGRTDMLQPIVADDAAYEGAGYLTQGTADDLGLGAGQAVMPEQLPIDYGVATPVRNLGGTTGGGAKLVEDSAGRRYVEKTGNSPGHIAEEHYADDVYEAMGVPVPRQELLPTGVKRANFIEGTTLNDLPAGEVNAAYNQLSEGFALDALLANWDAFGLEGDNVVVRAGVAYRIDNGGSLRFRAQGAPKGGMFGTSVGELETLRNPQMNEWGARVYGRLTEGDIRAQVLDLEARRETILGALPEELRATVSARLDDMLDRTAGVEPTAARGGRPVADAVTDDTHAYLVKHYNEVARLANEQGLGGYKAWTAADMALLAGRSRENLGRTPTSLTVGDIEANIRMQPAEVYYPKGSAGEKYNPLLDLLNQPENRAARDAFMQTVTVQTNQRLRDELGLVIDSSDTRGIGIWEGSTPQPLVPLDILGTPERGAELADVRSYTMQQAEVWHYTVHSPDEVAGNWAAYDPRLTLLYDGVRAKADAAEVAEKLGKQLPFARGATALELPNGSWQISIIDREGSMPRLPSGEVDEEALARMVKETEQGIGESNLGTDAVVEYGDTYVAGPDKLPDGTYDWGGHRAATEAKLQARGAAASAAALDGLRTAHDEAVTTGLEDAAPLNYGRIQRGEPISSVLEDNRGGQVFGTTTPAGANAAVIRGFGAADPLTGMHELVHVFSISGLDQSLREAVNREWVLRTTHVEARIQTLEARAASHTSKAVRTRAANEANALRAGLQSPTTGAWSKQQEEFFVHLVMDYIDRGVATNPDLGNALEHFRNWLGLQQKQRAANGLPPIQASPQMQAKLSRMFSRPGVETVPYSIEDEVMRQAARQTVRSSWDEAHATQYYKRDRSMLERSINHPYIGLYPASYMWGKVLPEMVRFLALRPFGMTTPFLAWNVAREVGDTIRTQSETDPSFKQFLKDNEDAFMFLSMFFPALPQDIPANVSLPVRRIAEQGLEAQQAYARGATEVDDIDYTRGATDAIQYAVGPLGTVRTVSDIAGMGGELISTVLGGEGQEDNRTLLPLR